MNSTPEAGNPATQPADEDGPVIESTISQDRSRFRDVDDNALKSILGRSVRDQPPMPNGSPLDPFNYAAVNGGNGADTIEQPPPPAPIDYTYEEPRRYLPDSATSLCSQCRRVYIEKPAGKETPADKINEKKLLIAGLDYKKITVQSIIDLLAPYGAVENVAMLNDGRGVVEVTLSSLSECEAAEDALDKIIYDGACLNVERAAAGEVKRVKILHEVTCTKDSQRGRQSDVYLDCPGKYKGDALETHLHGHRKTLAVDDHLEDDPGLAFVVTKLHTCTAYRAHDKNSEGRYRSNQLVDDMRRSSPYDEEIVLGSALLEAIRELIKTNQSRFDGFPADHFPRVIRPPYLVFYHHRRDFRQLLSEAGTLTEKQIEHIKLLLDYIEENWEADYAEADDLFSKGLVSSRHLTKLYKPKAIIITTDRDQLVGYEVSEWPWKEVDYVHHANIRRIDAWSTDERHEHDGAPKQFRVKPTTRSNDFISCWSYQFNGKFRTAARMFYPELPKMQDGDIGRIDSLEFYPARFATNAVVHTLRDRGRTVWDCRYARYVTYKGWSDSREEQNIDSRFMIDYTTYKHLHRWAAPFSHAHNQPIDADLMEMTTTPPDSTLILFPAYLYGYNLQEKDWVKLRCDRIVSVEWNRTAFQRLVLDNKSKELIEALVKIHTVQEARNMDLMAGKGNGLVILLHGGPGTGKTLTAESVAELVEKPLYRVTCGDIGTDAEKVEKYLQTIFYIGKKWKAVILLDEADVFLEERTLADLQRNALVSVFLRALEYYEGIIILTSNRVGTFDEAFKSRIQLSLHYPPLTPPQRKLIWANFLNLLEETEQDADIRSIKEKVDWLARVGDMNGRQIRNVVTTARHLAQFRGERMAFAHVKDAMETAGRFDEYLLKLHGHSAEDYAKEMAIR